MSMNVLADLIDVCTIVFGLGAIWAIVKSSLEWHRLVHRQHSKPLSWDVAALPGNGKLSQEEFMED